LFQEVFLLITSRFSSFLSSLPDTLREFIFGLIGGIIALALVLLKKVFKIIISSVCIKTIASSTGEHSLKLKNFKQTIFIKVSFGYKPMETNFIDFII
jgi:hypothetical protein